jgi:hypothetical protein
LWKNSLDALSVLDDIDNINVVVLFLVGQASVPAPRNAGSAGTLTLRYFLKRSRNTVMLNWVQDPCLREAASAKAGHPFSLMMNECESINSG